MIPDALCVRCAPIGTLQRPVFAEEWECVRNAVEKRQREFVAGRTLARQALESLGIPCGAILRGEDNVPVWPCGIVGSISHCDTHAAIAVAPAAAMLSAGIDIEIAGHVRPDLWPMIFTPEEICFLDTLPPPRQRRCATIGFAAKEAFYKCQFPVTRQWVEFTEASVEFEGDTEFTLRCQKKLEGLPHSIRGAIMDVDDETLVCVVWF